MQGVKDMTRDEVQEALKKKAIHHKAPKREQTPPEERMSTTERVEHIMQSPEGEPLSDTEGRPMKTYPFRTVVNHSGADAKADGGGKPDEPKDPDFTDSPIKVAAGGIPQIAEWINKSNPSVKMLVAVKEAEKKGLKRPQAHILLNKAIENRKTLDNQ